MSFKALLELSLEELNQQLGKLLKELASLRTQNYLSNLTDTSQIAKKRHEVSQVKTAISMKAKQVSHA